MGKFLKFLFFPAVALAIAGLVAKLVTGAWSPAAVGLVVGGIALLLVWLGVVLSRSGGFWKRRSTQVGTNALVATLSVLAILGLINFLAVRYGDRVDLTENRLFTLSPQSQELVEKLQQPLKVWLFESDPDPASRELLENYRRYSDKFEFKFVDPQIEVGLAQQFKVKSRGDVYLEYGDKRQLVQTLSPAESISEVKLTNAIEKIQRDRTQTVYFLQGHGEPTLNAGEGGMSEAVNSLKNKGYQVQPLNLAQSSAIPQDAAVIVVAGPKRKLFPGEVSALQDYLDGGGSLLLLLDPNTDTGLRPLLQEWGVQLDERIVIDASGMGNIIGLGPATPLINSYGSHPITKDFGNGISIYPLARTIGTVKVAGIEATALLLTNEKTWAESDVDAEELSFDPATDVQGPFDLGVALTRSETKSNSPKETETKEENPSSKPDASGEKEEKTEAETPNESSSSYESNTQIKTETSSSPQSANSQQESTQASTKSHLVVVGNSTFATNGWFEQQLNGDLFLNSVNWLASGEGETLSIRPKEPESRRLNLTSLQAGIIAWMALVIMPLFGLIAAGIAWWRRR